MGLFSKSTSDSPEARAGSKAGAKSGAKAGASADADIVRDARISARRRLIGAALLLGVGIIGFPLLFETQPRPIPVDIRIDIPSRDAAAPLPAPASRVAGLQGSPQATAPADTSSASGVVQREVVEAALPPTRSSPVEEPEGSVVASAPAERRATPPRPTERTAERAPERTPDRTPERTPERPAERPAERAAAATPPATTAEDGRYVVQIGAFAEADSAREARQKVERMGLKTYTQVIESASGRRIRVRVGPYPTKSEAEKAASKIKTGGLQAAILLL